jgi:hypothetical protein
MHVSRIATLLLSFGVLAHSGTPAEPSTSVHPACDVRLSIAIKPSQTSSDGWVEVTGTLKNEGSKAVVLVEPGDGSESGWRTPVLKWQARRIEQGRVTDVTLEPEARCGLMNGPDPKNEIFVLAPGQSHRLQWPFVMPRLKPPGLYEVAVTYTNDPRLGFRGTSPDDPAMTPYGNSTACTVTSQTLRVEVPKPSKAGLIPR